MDPCCVVGRQGLGRRAFPPALQTLLNPTGWLGGGLKQALQISTSLRGRAGQQKAEALPPCTMQQPGTSWVEEAGKLFICILCSTQLAFLCQLPVGVGRREEPGRGVEPS